MPALLYRPLKRALILIINREPRLESLGYFQSSAVADENALRYAIGSVSLSLIPSPSPSRRREKANKLFIDPRSSDILTT